MHCERCVKVIRESLAGLPGVQSCNVVIGLATIVFDAAATSRSALITAIRQAGSFEILGFTTEHAQPE